MLREENRGSFKCKDRNGMLHGWVKAEEKHPVHGPGLLCRH